jgi:hypothetical protein
MGEEPSVHIAPREYARNQVKSMRFLMLRDLALLRQTIYRKDLAFFDLLYALISEGCNKSAKPQKKRRITL